jgi:hypothetical protein
MANRPPLGRVREHLNGKERTSALRIQVEGAVGALAVAVATKRLTPDQAVDVAHEYGRALAQSPEAQDEVPAEFYKGLHVALGIGHMKGTAERETTESPLILPDRKLTVVKQ